MAQPTRNNGCRPVTIRSNARGTSGTRPGNRCAISAGGVVVWQASDTVGTPPPDIAQRFPGLVPEVPRAFEWFVTGRQPLLRIGWAIVRPKTP